MSFRVVPFIQSAYKLFRKSADVMQSPFLLAIRLYWGWQLMQSGWGKLHNLSQVTDFFASLNIPFSHANAVFVSNVEFFGGLLLILGLASRLNGLVLTVNMLVAYITADREALKSILSDPGKFYNADPYTFLFAALVMLFFGAGFFSVDTITRISSERAPGPKPAWPTSAASTSAAL
jgi:putative oxidoreductase